MTTSERNVLERIEAKIDGLDERLRQVEQKSAAAEGAATAQERGSMDYILARRRFIALVISASLSVAALALNVPMKP